VDKEQKDRLIETFLVSRELVDAIGRDIEPRFSIIKIVLPLATERAGLDKVDVIRPRLPWNQVYSFVNIYEERRYARLHYSTSIKYCWQRFAIAKECVHMMIDTNKRHVTRDAVDLVNRMMNKASSMLDGTDAEVDSEMAAIFGATELLLPSVFRSDILAMKSKDMTDRQIAEKYKAPELVVSAYLSESYQTLLDKMYSAVMDVKLLSPKK
jgi:hypothetical protein